MSKQTLDKCSPKIGEIIKRMGDANDTLRDCHNQLILACGFNDGIEYDGDYITKERIESWFKTLEDIDKVCHIV